GTLGVDVDPLVVAGAVGELVDACLVERRPRRGADLFADMLRQIAHGHDAVSHCVASLGLNRTHARSYQGAARLSEVPSRQGRCTDPFNLAPQNCRGFTADLCDT